MRAGGDILFCGVGGQGVVLASDIAALALMGAGFDVKKSEVHGMARRGGAVVSHLRYDGRVYSPLISPGGADIAVAFEMLEALRYLRYFKPSCKVIISTQMIAPPSVASGEEEYPDALGKLRRFGLRVTAVDAAGAAGELGEPKAANMVMLGALSRLLPVREKFFLGAISETVPERHAGVSVEAFYMGRALKGR